MSLSRIFFLSAVAVGLAQGSGAAPAHSHYDLDLLTQKMAECRCNAWDYYWKKPVYKLSSYGTMKKCLSSIKELTTSQINDSSNPWNYMNYGLGIGPTSKNARNISQCVDLYDYMNENVAKPPKGDLE